MTSTAACRRERRSRGASGTASRGSRPRSPARAAAFSTRLRRRQRGAVRLAQPRDPHRRRPRARGARTATRSREALGASAGVDRDGPPGARRRRPGARGAAAGRRAARARSDAQVTAAAGPHAAGAGGRLRAAGARGAGRRGGGPLRLARRRRRASSRTRVDAVARLTERAGRGARRARARDRAVLLRGRRRGARARFARAGTTATRCRTDGSTSPLAVRARARARSACDAEPVADCGLCTSCNPELFFSHRRDGGVTGRQAGLAWLSSLAQPRRRARARRLAAVRGAHRTRLRARGPRSAARSSCWRRPSTCRLELMGALADAGIELVGENIAAGRWRPSRSAGATASRWDFIGHLQSRKTKQVLPRVRLIHSVESESVLRADRAARERAPRACCSR